MASSSKPFYYAEEQTAKLANLIGTLKGEDEGGPFSQPIKELFAAENYSEVLTRFAKESKVLLGLGEKEFEPVYNLLIAMTRDANPDAVATHVKSIIQPIVDSPAEKAQVKLRVLSNLYNNLEVNSPSRYEVFVAIVNVAAKNDELDALVPQLASLDALTAQWGASLNQKRSLYLLLSEKLEGSEEHKREAYEYRLRYLATFENADAAALKTTKEQATRAVREAIRIPEVLNFEDLFRLQAVQALKPSKLFDLLTIFMEHGLAQYRAFVKSNAGFVAKEGLSEEANVKKMRLLSMATLAGKNVQGEVPYEAIAKELEIPEDEVEIWVINGEWHSASEICVVLLLRVPKPFKKVIRAGLIDAKMNQLKKTVVVSRSTHRVFSDAQWQQLSDKLAAWRTNLKEVLQVIANAKLIGAQGLSIETPVGA
ncbi:hypothetical protein HK104_009360 [Borealophlyctis nickersoniae]|nr:hypothetical protein HK104_009360 [Borealophlyctis nickersoniae]